MNECSIEVNGVPRTFLGPIFVDAVVARSVSSTRGIAVAVDRVVIPRSEWAATQVFDGASVEIVTAAAGG